MKGFIMADCNSIYSIACLLVTVFFIVQPSESYNTKENHTIVIQPGMPQLGIQTREIKTKVSVNETMDPADNMTCDYELRQIKVEYQTIWIQTEINYSSERPNTILALSKADERYTLTCAAPYLTRWTSTIIPNLPAKYGHPNRYDHNPFHFEADGYGAANGGPNFSSQFSFMLQNARSGFVQCESVSNASMATKVFFLAQDGFPFVQPLQHKEFQPPIITDTRQPFYVPCIANYPDIVPKLVEVTNRSSCPINHGTEVNINQSQIIGTYDPQLGFRLQGNGIENQHYRCNMGEESGKTRWYENQRITFDLSNPYVNPLTGSINLKFHLGSAEDEYPLGIWCSSSKNNTRNEIKMINCNSQYECDWLDACLNFEKCDEHQILQAVPFELNNQPNFQGIITSPFTRGKVVCISSINPAVFAYEYLFLGLDRGRYWLKAQAHEIPKRAIIYMTETDSVIYSNKPALFSCETSNFVLSSNIKFAAVLKNNTSLLLDKINTTRDPAIFLGNDLGFSRKEILINVTTDFIGIMCLAPWLNSSQWINTTRTFEVRDVKTPFIYPPLNATREGTAKAALITFYKGDKTQSLFCNATGEPRPKIKWFLPSEQDIAFWHYKLEEPTLHFPVIQANLQGKYNCVATNEYGSDYLVFDVAVETARPGIKTATIVGISGAFLVLLVGLGVAIKKYVDVKKKRRNLTPEEIKEFLYGNSEILKESTDGIHTEDGIQSMAFNPDYEILSSDLSLDGCQTLGEGQFGKVVQGHLKGTAVAVKTTKPNADVAYFLALLSELKIMAYIANEKHPNIVEFLGAVVSEIEKRSVFVVVELSSMGNMHTFLFKLGSAGLFLDLLNQDGSINLDEHTYEEVKCKFSTLNLISWCQQIASGMEFLASKRVIHGDLATRNVLMFDNDVVKITDFGLSRKLYESPQYVKKRGVAMPVAWMAIESLRFMQFSVQSDVWAFAVTVWEIFSMGEIPYAGVSSTDFVKNLMGGMRLERPIYAPHDIHTLLLSCWGLEPTQRPSFSTLQIFFDDYLKEAMQTLEVENEENSDAVQIAFAETEAIAGSYHSFW